MPRNVFPELLPIFGGKGGERDARDVHNHLLAHMLVLARGRQNRCR